MIVVSPCHPAIPPALTGRRLRRTVTKDLVRKLSPQSLPIEITNLSELSSMESIRASLTLSGVVSFDDGKPQSIVCSQDGAEETSFLATAKGAIYWRKS